jgi:hypothetical protein
MTTELGSPPADPPERALDAALAQALSPPVLPPAFRTRLDARVGDAAIEDRAAATARLEREYLAGLAELDAGYVRLRRRTVGLLLCGGLLAGAALPLILPWLQSRFGSYAPPALALLSAAAALGIAWCLPTRLTLPAED